jgi:predicted DNA-binding transcriptional regulator AlpA
MTTTPPIRARHAALPPNLPPRGLSRGESAAYVGVSPSFFDGMVDRGQMPPAKKIEGRRVWDIRELDAAFSALPQVAERDDPKTCSIWKKAH